MPGSESEKHYELAVGISIEALKAVFYFNAGAAGALIALTDRTSNRHDYTLAILAFGVGTLLAVVSFAIGYGSQLAYANHQFSHEQGDAAGSRRAHKSHEVYQNLAIGFVVAALLSGAVGMVLAFLAAIA